MSNSSRDTTASGAQLDGWFSKIKGGFKVVSGGADTLRGTFNTAMDDLGDKVAGREHPVGKTESEIVTENGKTSMDLGLRDVKSNH